MDSVGNRNRLGHQLGHADVAMLHLLRGIDIFGSLFWYQCQNFKHRANKEDINCRENEMFISVYGIVIRGVVFSWKTVRGFFSFLCMQYFMTGKKNLRKCHNMVKLA